MKRFFNSKAAIFCLILVVATISFVTYVEVASAIRVIKVKKVARSICEDVLSEKFPSKEDFDKKLLGRYFETSVSFKEVFHYFFPAERIHYSYLVFPHDGFDIDIHVEGREYLIPYKSNDSEMISKP